MKLVLNFFVAILLCLPLKTFAADKRTAAPDLGTMTGAEAEAFYTGLTVVIWGYPEVKFEELMRARTDPGAQQKTGNPRSQVNQFGLMRHLRGPEFKQIATPNNDTLYAQAFVDISPEPLILSVPAVDEKRYYGFQLWDPNGDTFAYISTRATGRAAGNYALVGPDWKGVLPNGVKRIDSAYNSFVIWGRIGVDGPNDLKNALAIEDQLRLTPLSKFGVGEQQVPPDIAFSAQRVTLDNPQHVTGDLLFYVELANALRYTPPKPQDVVIADSLPQIGFSHGGTIFDANALSDAQKKGLSKALQFGLYLMDVSAQSAGTDINGWRWSAKSGIMGTDYLFRAAFAKWFTGGNAPQEAIYMDCRADDKGDAFTGQKRYVIHFAKGQLPPAKAFWSVSMYNLSDGSFVANAANRYSLGDRTPGLVSNPDGSLDIYIQHLAPADSQKMANWLPAPKEGFYLNLRLYGPDNRLQTGKWEPPAVNVVN